MMKAIVTAIAMVWMIVGTIALVPAGFVPMMFDLLMSRGHFVAVCLFWSVISFPFVCYFAAIASWTLMSFEREKVASAVVLLPFLNILNLILCMAMFITIESKDGGLLGG